MILNRLRYLQDNYALKLLRIIYSIAYRPFYRAPFTKDLKATADQYKAIWKEAINSRYPQIDSFETAHGAAINTDWLNQLALQTQVVVKDSEICFQHGRLLYAALAEYIRSPAISHVNILETGTARGFSSLCMAKALDDAKVSGKITTFDILPHDQPILWNCIADIDGPKSRAELLLEYEPLLEKYLVFIQGDSKLQHKKVHSHRIHFAFLDGAHTFDDVMFEFGFVENKQLPGDIIFFDDYTPKLFPGIVAGVDEICAQSNYSKEVISIGDQRGYVLAIKQ